MEIEQLHNELINKLASLFGEFEPERNKFKNSSNTEIARELGYSDAQFSRLSHGTASEGEFHRAIKNINRILLINELSEKLENSPTHLKYRLNYKFFAIIVVILIAVMIISVNYLSGIRSIVGIEEDENIAKDYTLQWAFETSFINPYVGLNDLPRDCNFPCYKYQGKWKLDKTYKLPFFRERNGFHYLATDINMYARCMTEKSKEGAVIEGYEYQKHEIWYDLREWPIDSFLNSNKSLQTSYQELDFTKNENFVKLADIHTFFRNEFLIDSLEIYRTGKVIGRDLEIVEDKILQKKIPSAADLTQLKTEINLIVANRLEDFSIPINCQNAKIINPDFNEVKEGDKMGFNCQLTTSRLSINYHKIFVLDEQYIKNKCVTVK